MVYNNIALLNSTVPGTVASAPGHQRGRERVLLARRAVAERGDLMFVVAEQVRVNLIIDGIDAIEDIQNLVNIEVVEVSGGELPTMDFEFRTRSEELVRRMNERSEVQLGLGDDSRDMASAGFTIQHHQIRRSGDNFWLVKAGAIQVVACQVARARVSRYPPRCPGWSAYCKWLDGPTWSSRTWTSPGTANGGFSTGAPTRCTSTTYGCTATWPGRSP